MNKRTMTNLVMLHRYDVDGSVDGWMDRLHFHILSIRTKYQMLTR